MGKTLTIHDDQLGAAASVRIEQTPGQPPLITELKFTADPGAGLSSQVLALMNDMGLTLPATAPTTLNRRPRKQVRPAARKPAARKAPAAKTAPAPREPEPDTDDPAPAAAALPSGARPALTAAISSTPAGAAPAQRRTRRTGPPPGVDELREVFVRHEGELAAMAAELGASVSSVAGWLRKAREAGAVITLPTGVR